MKPSLAKLWETFPDHTGYPTLKDLYSMLGGTAERNIDCQGFRPDGNTCASRLSIAFNRSGAPISASVATAVGAKTLSAGDGSRIIFRLADFRKYLLWSLGRPTVDKTSPFDSAFRGKRGIIAFTVNWHNATGHIALWSGLTYREPSHDNYSTYIEPRVPDVRTSRAEFWPLP